MTERLDRALEEAIAATESVAARAEQVPAPPSPPRRHVGLLATLLVMGGGLSALMLVGFKDAAIYAKPVDQLVAARGELVGRRVRVDGELVPGTLVRRELPCEYRFVMQANRVELPVRYAQCAVPDTFRDMPGGGVEVTAEGRLSEAGEFEATLILAKCTSKYDPNTHQMRDEATAGVPAGPPAGP